LRVCKGRRPQSLVPYIIKIIKRYILQPGMMAHASNPSYLGKGDRRIVVPGSPGQKERKKEKS
jgi:hypothetical protein